MRRLERQLPLAAFMLLTIVAASVTLAAYRYSRSTERALFSERLLRLSEQLAGTIGESIARAQASLLDAATDPAIIEVATAVTPSRAESARSALALAIRGMPTNVAAGVWDLSGDLVVSVGDGAVADWMPQPPLVEEPTVTGVAAEDDTLVHYGIVVPIRDGRQLVGFVQLRQRLAGGANTAAIQAVLGSTGRILLGSPGGAWTDLSTRVDAPAAGAIGAESAIDYDRHEESVFGLGRSIGGTPLAVVTEVGGGAVLSSTRAFVAWVGTFAAFFVGAATLAAWLLGRRITGPLARLRTEAEAVGRGEYGARAPETGHPEIVQLSRAFNKMASDTAAHMTAVRASELRFRSLVTATAQIVWWTDADGNVVEPIPSWQEYTGQAFEGTTGAGWTAALHPDDAGAAVQAWKDAVRKGQLFETEYRIRGGDGEYRWFFVRAVPMRGPEGGIIEWVITCSDITARREAEARLETKELELQRSQRLDAVGRLAGGIAHDFNNLLTAILGPAELASLALPDGHPVRDDLRDIRAAAHRAADLTRKLLAFGRQQVLSPVVLDVNEAIESAGNLLKRIIGEAVKLRIAPMAIQPTIRVDRTQLEQVIVNLAVNARDAMPEGGTLTIETSNVDVDSEMIVAHRGLKLGRYLVLAVTDDGTGMDATTQKQIFEPFFTTKSMDKGTGLGLSTVYGIVKQSEGEIWVYSEPGHGTSFKIYFPSVSDAATPVEPAAEGPAPGGTETVLLAEDDDVVRRLGVRTLTSMGYTVLDAPNAVDAMRLAAGHRGTIHLLLSDLVMPDMNGVELWEELQVHRPGLPALFLSGWASDAIVGHGMLEGTVPFLQKPFSARQLGLKIREVLAQTA